MDVKKVLKRFKRSQKEKDIVNRTFKVVGVTFENRQEKLKKIYVQYQTTKKYPNCNLILDDGNIYDKNAVGVFLFDEHGAENIGFISKEENQLVRKFFGNITDVKIREVNAFDDNGTIKFYVNIDVCFEEEEGDECE